MKVSEALTLKEGDGISFPMIGLKGSFVKLEGPFLLPEKGEHYRIWWTGWDPFHPARQEWTWDWALEKTDEKAG